MQNFKPFWLSFITGCVASLASFAEPPIAGEEIAKFVRRAKSDAKLPHTFAMTDYVVSDSRLPIGVFDSGIGGLTVLEAVLGLDAFNNDTLQPKSDGRLDFEGEKFIYLGDQANMPYGNYPSSGKEDYLRELILKDTVFLLGRRFWPSVNAERPSFDKPRSKPSLSLAIRPPPMDWSIFEMRCRLGRSICR